MVQTGVDGQDSYGSSINHKLDHMIGNREFGQLVQVGRTNYESGQMLHGIPFSADISWRLAIEGRIFVAADADQNDRVTGQTSFANTTPTFLLDNPANSNVIAIPFYYQLAQTGSVAGGDIAVETELVYPSAYASGGTSERVRHLRIGYIGSVTNKCRLFSGATATAGYGIAAGHVTLAADVSGAEGIINIYEWQAPSGTFLDANTSLNVFSSAGTTGPTFGWHFCWAEMPVDWLTN